MRLLLAVAISLMRSLVTAAPTPAAAPPEEPTAADLEAGRQLYAVHCARCHGFTGGGGAGPPLARPKLRRAPDEKALVGIITDGIRGTSMPSFWPLSKRETTQVAAYVRSLGAQPADEPAGEPARGRLVYERAGCAACHIVGGAGSGLGPDLSDIGAVRGTAFLRESLLDPGAARPERAVPYEPYRYPAYAVVRVKPAGAPEVQGVRLNEDSFTIQLRDLQGRLYSLRKAELERLASDPGASVMPSYRGVLTDAELDDLVAHLKTLEAKR